MRKTCVSSGLGGGGFEMKNQGLKGYHSWGVDYYNKINVIKIIFLSLYLT